MTTKTKIIGLVIIILTSFAFGRWAAPTKVVTKTETVYVEKKTDNKSSETKRKVHKVITNTTITYPDGTRKTTSIISYVDDTDNKTNEKQTDSQSDTKTSEKDVTRSSDKVTISALGGLHLSDGIPVYGASVTKPILGPITTGVWGLNNGTVGASVGLSF